MDRQLAERLKSKSVQNAIISQIAEDFNLTPLLAEAYFNQIKDYFLEHTDLSLSSGQIHYRSAELTTKPEPGRTLMIGDALGDLRAARGADCLFYPIIPGGEEESWERFHDEIIDVFLEGRYTEEWENRFLADFRAALPEKPLWSTAG